MGNLASYIGAPTSGSTVTYLYYSGHGDLAAEANNLGTRTAAHNYDPFGAPLDAPPADQTSHRYTGRWNKQYDSTSNLVLMGARPYDPAIGRFLAVDPIEGGAANNYDYAGQDPVNSYDLDGSMIKADDTAGRPTQLISGSECGWLGFSSCQGLEGNAEDPMFSNQNVALAIVTWRISMVAEAVWAARGAKASRLLTPRLASASAAALEVNVEAARPGTEIAIRTGVFLRALLEGLSPPSIARVREFFNLPASGGSGWSGFRSGIYGG